MDGRDFAHIHRVLEAVEEGTLGEYDMLLMCLKFMGDTNVKAMLAANEVDLFDRSDLSEDA